MSAFEVQLYRYDLTGGMARSLSPMLLGRQIEGIWHTSVVVHHREFYFDGGVGIVCDPSPGNTRFGPPYRREVIGTTTKSLAEFSKWTQQKMSAGFGPNDYNLLQNNCNHFTQAASLFLIGKDIPSDIREMIPLLLQSPLGQMLRPSLEQMTSTAAPPAAPQPPLQSYQSTASVAGDGGVPSCRGLLSARGALTESETEDLVLASVMLESNELIAVQKADEGVQLTLRGVKLLRDVMQRIVDNPQEAKWRALSTSSETYATRLKPLEDFGIDDILRVAGFKRRPHHSGEPGSQWFLADADGSAAVLREVISVLEKLMQTIKASDS